MARPVIAVVGPTASGKSRLAQDIALRYGGEVVSADSMQVYKGMDIGTGKLKASERKVVHHGLDLLEPNAPYSVALYQGFARECFRQIDSRGNYAILCGGSGFYVRAALDDYEFPSGEQSENPLREHYRRIAKEKGSFALWELLKDADAQSAELIHPNNVRRVIRAFELLAEGKSYSGQLSQLAHIVQAVPAVFLGLSVEPEILRGRIGKRVDAMIEEGLL
ncbi:MAG: tRNA (adenosine(37)-N6)-dimethylallyltransferase MiaA, partial [Eggerthellaceae bacterium]|nr:tRNA (adenosine(37)-N6)-dimethylallyltransferase MiaA [Eggerthellaceae bacterium]